MGTIELAWVTAAVGKRVVSVAVGPGWQYVVTFDDGSRLTLVVISSMWEAGK